MTPTESANPKIEAYMEYERTRDHNLPKHLYSCDPAYKKYKQTLLDIDKQWMVEEVYRGVIK